MVTLFRELEFALWCIFDGLRASRYSWTECYALARDLIVSPDLSVFRTQSNDVSEFSQTVTYRDILQLWSRNRLLQVSPREYSLPLYEYFSGRSSESFGALVWFTLLGNPRDTIEADAALAFDERQAIPSADSSVLSESGCPCACSMALTYCIVSGAGVLLQHRFGQTLSQLRALALRSRPPSLVLDHSSFTPEYLMGEVTSFNAWQAAQTSGGASPEGRDAPGDASEFGSEKGSEEEPAMRSGAESEGSSSDEQESEKSAASSSGGSGSAFKPSSEASEQTPDDPSGEIPAVEVGDLVTGAGNMSMEVAAEVDDPMVDAGAEEPGRDAEGEVAEEEVPVPPGMPVPEAQIRYPRVSVSFSGVFPVLTSFF